MTERAAHLGRRMFLLVAVGVAFTASLAMAQNTAPASASATVAAAAATPAADPTLGITFDVVSIKPAPEGPSRITNPLDGDGITVENSTMLEMVRWNFNKSSLRENQLQGVPKWFTTDNYEIRAKVAESDIAAWQKIGEGGHRLVFRKMLADRFKFAWHFADVDSPIYNLVVAKGGLKIQEAKPDEASPYNFKLGQNPDGTPAAYKGAGVTMRSAPDGYPMYVMQQLHMPSFAKNFLSGDVGTMVGRPVVDKTGLTGAYNFSLVFAFDRGVDAAATNDTGPARPTIFTALQEQLGLKLEPARGPVETLVIDHIERPPEN